MKFQDAIETVHAAMRRQSGSFAVTPDPERPDGFALVAGHFRAVRVAEGTIITLRLNRAQLEHLRDEAAHLLSEFQVVPR